MQDDKFFNQGPPAYGQHGYPQSGFPQQGYPQQGPPPPPGFYQQPPMGPGGYGQPPPIRTEGGGMYNDGHTVEANSFLSNNPTSFTDIKIRHQFIRKVYSLVTLQVLITTGFIALIKLTPPIAKFFYVNSWTLWLLLIGTVIIMLVLACCESVARSYPINLILLMAFTLLESVLLGCISSQYKTDTLLIAAGITTVVVIGITLFAFQTKIDFTGCGIYLFVLSLVLFGFGLLAIIIRSNIMHLLYAAGGAALFSFYLVFDTQLMLGGKHKYSISPEDYIIAALNLYVDIINLFLMILRLVSAAKD